MRVLNASDSAAIVAESSAKISSGMSMNWVEKVRTQRIRVEHPEVARNKNRSSLKELIIKDYEREHSAKVDKNIEDTIDTDSDVQTNLKRDANQQLNAVDWAQSLFEDDTRTDVSILTQVYPKPTLNVLEKPRRRPHNLEMVPNVSLDFEPFWRTEPFEKVRCSQATPWWVHHVLRIEYVY